MDPESGSEDDNESAESEEDEAYNPTDAESDEETDEDDSEYSEASEDETDDSDGMTHKLFIKYQILMLFTLQNWAPMRNLARIGQIWSARPLKRIATMITMSMINATENSRQRSTAKARSTGKQSVKDIHIS